jgi:hypothetical protein
MKASVVVVVALTGLACVDGRSLPTAPYGTLYDLVTIGGVALPAGSHSITASTNGVVYRCDELTLSQRITLDDSDFSSHGVTQYRWTCDQSQYSKTFADTVAGEWSASGHDVTIIFSSASIYSTLHGVLDGSANLTVNLVETKGQTGTTSDAAVRLYKASGIVQ